MKTSFPKPEAPRWFVVDAKDKILGRMASRIAMVIKGKHRATYVPHLPCGDHVIVVNASAVRVTGSKLEGKVYSRHTGWFGGLKQETLKEMMERTPMKAIELAVKGMLPKNSMREHLLKRLHVYAGSEHEHSAQKPVELRFDN